MSAFTSYIGDKIEAKRDQEVVAVLAGVSWHERSGSLIFDRLFDYSKEPFDVVINDSITLPNLVIMNSGRLHTDVTYEFEQLT